MWNEVNGAALFNAVDKYLTDNSKKINIDVPLDELGSFCNLVLPYLQNLLKAADGEPEQFTNIVGKCQKMFVEFRKLLKDKDAKFLEVIDRLLVLLNQIEQDKENVLAEVSEIYKGYYSLFYGQMKRAQAHIILTTGKQSRTKEVTQAQDGVTKYLNRTLEPQKPADIRAIDPLLLDVESCQAVEKFLRKNRKPFLKCFCGQRADMFALPCNCPCYCSDCWEFEGDSSAENCPRCHRQVTQFVEVTHDAPK